MITALAYIFVIALILGFCFLFGHLDGSYKYIPGSGRRAKQLPERDPSDSTKALVWYRDKGRCQHCGTTGTPDNPLEYDHIVPYSWGGNNTAENIQLLCHCHNMKKGNRYVG
jgi:hypothetical protein